MTKDLKQKWVDALRSGEYKQCQLSLKKDNKYCCLGVLACVSDPNFDFNSVDSYSVIRKLGMTDNQMQNFWTMNDSDELSFDEIADYIEQDDKL